MINFSRRQLAKYSVDEMLAKTPAAKLAARLTAALVASGRQKEIELLLSDIDQELEERGLLANARLTSAFPLSANLKSQLAAQLQKKTGTKEVGIQEQIDKSVIGGFKAETATRSWDKTVWRTLRNFKETL